MTKSKNLKILCLKMDVNDISGYSNLKTGFWGENSHLFTEGSFQVQTISMQELVNLENPILVKMDIEGEKCNIFRNNDAWLEQIDLIAIEPHGCIKEIVEKLRNLHNRRIDKNWRYFG